MRRRKNLHNANESENFLASRVFIESLPFLPAFPAFSAGTAAAAAGLSVAAGAAPLAAFFCERLENWKIRGKSLIEPFMTFQISFLVALVVIAKQKERNARVTSKVLIIIYVA